MSFSTCAPASPAPISEHAGPLASVDGAPPEREQPALEPDRAEDHDRRRAPEHDHGERDRPVARGRRARRARATSTKLVSPDRTHAPRLLHARVAPHLPVEPEQVVARAGGSSTISRAGGPEVPPVLRRHTAVEAEDERDQVRGHDDERVEQRERHVAPDAGDDAARQAGRAGRRGSRASRSRHLIERATRREGSCGTHGSSGVPSVRSGRSASELRPDGTAGSAFGPAAPPRSIGTPNASAMSADISAIVDVPSQRPNTIVAVGFRWWSSVVSSS